MKKVYYLSSCTTCKRIIDELGDRMSDFEKQDIKTDLITDSQLDEMKDFSGSYVSLFSRKAMKYRSMGLADKELTEADYRELILKEYTFLKRPVFIVNDQIFVGNDKKVIEALNAAI